MLSELMSLERLADMINYGYVRERRHPERPLRILNYTEATQFANKWNDVTLQCRGLVVHDDGTVVARPMRKFFNWEEHSGGGWLPPLDLNVGVHVTDKVDGSLGIGVPTQDGLIVATRGSFESDQAKWATRHYRENYADVVLNPAYTYLWEIVFDANRIVVKYDFEDLVLLGAVHIQTGAWCPARYVQTWPGRRVREFSFASLRDALAAPVRDNAEGLVIHCMDGIENRWVKLKQSSYVALHGIVTGLSERRVWDHASGGGELADLVENLPDEFHSWTRNVWDELHAEHARIIGEARTRFESLLHAQRKYFATLADDLDPQWRPLMFYLLDQQHARLDSAVWKTIRPVGDTRLWNQDAA